MLIRQKQIWLSFLSLLQTNIDIDIIKTFEQLYIAQIKLHIPPICHFELREKVRNKRAHTAAPLELYWI